MYTLIDGDIIKYSVGFACQYTVYYTSDNQKFRTKRMPGGGMRVIDEDGALADTKIKEARSTQEALTLMGYDYEHIVEGIEVEPESHCLHSVKQLITSILRYTTAREYLVTLSRGQCFRHKLFPDYKRSRLATPKPELLPTIEDYLINKWGARIYEDIEADDAMGIIQCSRRYETCIATLDKDLDCIPGYHYNWTRKQLYFVEEDRSLRNFWKQVLTGDSTDDIPGLPKVGPKTAGKLIAGFPVDELPERVWRIHEEVGTTREEFERNCQLLWILRKPYNETYGI